MSEKTNFELSFSATLIAVLLQYIHASVTVVGIVYSKFNAVYFCNGTTDAKKATPLH